jgi:polar amino acid transport system permease protein
VDGGLHRRTGHRGRLSTTTLTRRQAFERRQRRRSNAIAVTSTVIVVTVLVVLVPRAPGWERVQRSFFNGPVFRDSFPQLLRAFQVNLQILAWNAPAILVLSTLVALARGVRSPALFPLRAFAAIFTDVFRGIPTILVILLIGFGVPAGLQVSREWSSPFLWGPIAIVLSYTGYVAEIVRSGIDGVHESQRAAARSIGMTSRQTMWSVVLPQAFRRVTLPMLNSFISLQKDIVLLSLLGVTELLRRAQIIQGRTFNFTPYVAAAVIFLALTIPQTRIADYLMERQRRRTGGTLVG